MSMLSAKISELATSFQTFVQNLITKINEPREEAESAEMADLFDGATINDHIDTLTGIYNPHLSDTNNPHGLTPASINAPSRSAFDALVGQYLPALSSIISRYGRNNFLDPNVQGSFDSGSGNNEHREYPINLEKDGTLVMLRNATDGGDIGVYYSYSANAAGPTLSPFTHTGKRYRPSFIPNDREVAYLYRSGKGILTGRLKDKATGQVVNEFFLALTNGTFDDKAHIGFRLSGQFGETRVLATFLPLVEFVLADDTIYAVSVHQFSTPVCLYYYRCFIGNLTPGWDTQLSFVSVQGPLTYDNHVEIKTSTDGSIRLADRVYSADANQNPLILGTGPITSCNIVEGSNRGALTVSRYKDGKIRTYLTMDTSTAYTFSLGNALKRMQAEASFLYDIEEQRVTNDAQTELPMQLVVDGDELLYQSPGFRTTFGLTKSTPNTRSFSVADGRGFFFSFSNYYQADVGWNLSRLAFPVEASDAFTALAINDYENNASGQSRSSPPTYATAITGRIRPMAVLPNGILSAQLNAVNGRTEFSFSEADFGSSVVHRSVRYPEGLNGYAITTNRFVASNELECLASLLKQDGTVTTFASRFISGERESRQQHVGNNGALTGPTVTLTEATRQALGLAVSNLIGNNADYVLRAIDVVIPSDVNIPCFGVMVERKADRRSNRIFSFAFEANTREGEVTSWTNLRLGAGEEILAGAANDRFIFRNSASEPMLGIVNIIETDTHYLIDQVAPIQFIMSTSARNFAMLFAIDKATKDITNSRYYTSPFLASGGNYHFALPGKGYGYIIDLVDSGTKGVLAPVGTTVGNFIPYPGLSGPSSGYWVMVTQMVAEGYVVYFLDETPIVMGGRKGTLMPTTIDLRDIDPVPSNKTFYVYATYDVGNHEFIYEILSTSDQQDSDDTMLIGTVTTGDSVITSIDVGNVTRLGKYRLSTEPNHSAIPVSSGLPMNPAKLNWS